MKWNKNQTYYEIQNQGKFEPQHINHKLTSDKQTSLSR